MLNFMLNFILLYFFQTTGSISLLDTYYLRIMLVKTLSFDDLVFVSKGYKTTLMTTHTHESNHFAFSVLNASFIYILIKMKVRI